ncbi:MAG: N-methyl-D-aspartate receptor NMDAR2C subunit [Moraxellaceae bacterium]|nr:N-methyl-D-aspartate receptor NMDAR2C subunit [Moraxellaceae bacterium]
MDKSQWLDLMARLSFADNLAYYQLLQSHYNEKHRHYHNQTHISACLQHLQNCQNLADDKNAVELALWFHDVIYDVFSAKNELKSAELASQFLQENQADNALIDKVYQLIMATCHNANLQDNDEQLITDIDLTILGSSEKVYQQFEQNVRKEYKLIPSFIYRKKRKQVLQSFLAKQRIYHHDYFYQKFEKTARKNLTLAIASC